jgi:protein-tyrosine phosphatase
MSSWLGPRSVDGGIDVVPLPRGAGVLSLCGKHVVGPDPVAALARADATTVVCLVEAHELDDRYPAYLAWLHEHRGHDAVWFPIHDLHAPALDRALPFLHELLTRLDRGEHLLMHCGAGIGRAGTMATCLLVERGMSADEALALVAASRPMAGPEVGTQLELVRALEAHRAGQPEVS